MGCSCAGRSVRNLWRALNSDDLKKMGAAVDEQASQDDENQSYGDERAAIFFEEWVAPPAVVADRRVTSIFKTFRRCKNLQLTPVFYEWNRDPRQFIPKRPLG